MTSIRLTKSEIDRIKDLFDTVPQVDDLSTVLISQSSTSGIGPTITATFKIMHQGQKGDFVVAITDFTDW
jgi:hypothetical protein